MIQVLLGMLAGGAIGAFVGWRGRCTTGACPLTSNPYLGGVFGALLGMAVAATLVERGRGGEVTVSEFMSSADSTQSAAFVHVDSETAFDTLVRDAKAPVLVDFWATWCPPCRVQGKILDEVAGAAGGRVVIAKVDVDKVQALAERFTIQSIPTLMMFREGKLQWKRIGVQSRDSLLELLNLGAARE